MLVLVGIVFALPLPPAQVSHAEPDGDALQPAPLAADPVPVANLAQVQPGIPAGMEARLLARLRHEVHADVEDLAMQSMERAVRQLRLRDGTPKRPLGKVLRLTFSLQPEVAGIAPVSVLTRTTSYSAFADTFSGDATFKFNVVGDLQLVGLQRDHVTVDFSTLVQFDDAGKDEGGSSGANGSADVTIGESEILMSVGSRNLVLQVDEVR